MPDEVAKRIGDNLKQIMKDKKISARFLAETVGISPTYLSYLANGKRKPSLELLEAIASTLNVSVDRLTGESVSALIEARLEELGKTETELAEKADVPLHWLQNLDTFIPGQIGDYEIGYDWITRIADILGLPSSKLRAALARQEIPVYDGPKSSIEDDFINESFHEYKIKDLTPVTSKVVRIPLLGKIPAGVPVECEENIIGYIEVPESEVKNGEYFYLKVQGDSMAGSGIMNGYNVLVRRQPEVESGEIAVVRVNAHDATLKRVKKVDGKSILYPDNPKYEPIVISNNEAEIIGKVIKVEFDPNKKY